MASLGMAGAVRSCHMYVMGVRIRVPAAGAAEVSVLSM